MAPAIVAIHTDLAAQHNLLQALVEQFDHHGVASNTMWSGTTGATKLSETGPLQSLVTEKAATPR
jgi:hypothetical protein